MLEFVQGDMFETPADIRVNTVNCVGVMGAGVARRFKERYPIMFDEYRRACKRGEVQPGKLHVWRELGGDWVINFPTKRDWRDPSRYEDIEAGLDALRSYLEPLGDVTVAVPALGCGHGSLDWDRVSQVIKAKLADLDAKILVFPPAASRDAHKKLDWQPSEDEIESASLLGYHTLTSIGSAGASDTPLFTNGLEADVRGPWIAFLPSRQPTDREWGALRSIASGLASTSVRPRVALVHQGKATEEIAYLFATEGLDTVVFLPFGVLTRKSVAKVANENLVGSITLVSTAAPSQKWSRQLVAEAMNKLRESAAFVMLSDPAPEWLLKRKNTWQGPPFTYVRYEGMPDELREHLSTLGARAIGRKSVEEVTNIEPLLEGFREHVARQAPRSDVTSSHFNRLFVDLCDYPENKWDAIISLLRNATLQEFKVEVKVESDSLAAALQDRLDRLAHPLP